MRDKKASSYGLTKLNESIPMICLYWSVKPKDVLGKKRISNVMFARHSLRYLLSLDKTLTLAEIGTLTNGDHASVIHSKKMFELYVDQDIKFQELKSIMSGVLEYKKHSSRNFRVAEVIDSDLNTKQKVKMLDTIYYED
jgi:chromosomal replication initiation ATPase DnaA